MKGWKHFCTITKHKMLVLQGCWKAGMYWQGICHDLSKYGYTEFHLGCKYYLGEESPHNGERRAYGFSYGWLHHKGRNKHHMEYWTDYSADKRKGLVAIKMPKKYVLEMFIDRVGACKNYQKEKYTDASPWKYYDKQKEYYILHPDSKKLLEKLLLMLRDEGEDAVYAYIKNTVRKIDFPY